MILRDFIEEANRASTLYALLETFERSVRRLEYERFSFSHLRTWDVPPQSPPPPTGEIVALNYPSQWVGHYQERGYLAEDPVVRHARGAILPYRWDDVAVHSEREMLILQEAGDVGLKHGLSVPIHEPHGKVFLVTLASDRPGPICMDTCSRIQAMAVVFHARYSLLGGHEWRPTHITLTSREAECLTWVARGKSSWDIGQLMGVSEHTVNFHLKNAMRKLDTASRITAAVRAVSMGLICPP
ncbi:LuxR family transcriptional regulator [Pelomonas sp. CA6]|uniref:LuxR family transcriptional regulator n=1 Tax=Pelomonas sp. CA6 TaxID=2907999 RepID=UPI001F4BD985|nr:LuxR family transcriptional regulator [Pelomonas sp. CA6]MCH7344775.1 LuxR family transcriptional regulator [Pelomonas sp. CA6]